MNTLHRIVGTINLLFFILTLFIVPMAASFLGAPALLLLGMGKQ